MKICSPKFICAFLFVYLSGCKGTHSRPASVPPSAVWVDNTFVDCSVEPQSRADRCTVYKQDTGEILADGLFVLNSSNEAADKSELHYAAFGDEGIYLEDARILLHRVATHRDPSNRIMDDRLKALASRGRTEAIDCSYVKADEKIDTAGECALKAFAARRPFYVRYYLQGDNSFGYMGFAGDADGMIYGVQYYSRRVPVWIGVLPKEAQLLDGNHTLVMPCPKPITLTKTEDGEVSCIRPVS
jgi:hypothetical protein